MRRAALIGSVAALPAVAASVAFAASGSVAGPPPKLADASAHTAQATSRHFAVDVHILKKMRPLVLHIRGAAARGEATVHLKLDDVTLPDGTVVPGPEGALLLDGPFLYERAPNGAAVGKLRWLRRRVSDLGPSSTELANLRNLTPAPLLRVLDEAAVARVKHTPATYRGTVAYDDPIVRAALRALTANIEFRGLRVTAWVGRDGLVHALRLTGRTADRSTSLRLDARMFAFGRPVHVVPPPQGAFLDLQRELLAN